VILPTRVETMVRVLVEPIAFFRSLREQLQVDAKTRPESLEALSSAAYQHAHLSHEIGDRDDVDKSFAEGIAVLDRLVREHPSEPSYQSKLALTHYGAGFVKASMGQPREAHELKEYPSTTDYQSHLGGCYLSLSQVAIATGQPNEFEAVSPKRGRFSNAWRPNIPSHRILPVSLARRSTTRGSSSSTPGISPRLVICSSRRWSGSARRCGRTPETRASGNA